MQQYTYVQRQLLERRKFLHPKVEAPVTVPAEAAAAAQGACA